MNLAGAGSLVQAHPWHGISAGEYAPEIVNAFIETVPFDTVKYEIDKDSGHLKLDRPHKYSSLCPTLYGFVPRTYCDQAVAQFAAARCGRPVERGDRDPLDICVLTESTINRSGILVSARPIGGFRLFDRSEVDDKIIAVLLQDSVFGECTNLGQVPRGLLERLKHYFLTYKESPEDSLVAPRHIEISDVYDAAEARQVIEHARADYATLVSSALVAPF
ncbi:inorganic pyrophosphatase [Hydrogenispora ethanolica]|uniref:inorganic diphosphatase n=1 Tax=Hydrogenispora ethanolica TaxID=1082276 RepID=A0A4R1RIW0_HYDET|nr:inorganic pyrophosphatase [Hydrogenispora ethanolica]TCL65936.1 inorganic pyrophosphatase [Hydrogenispora ethanolica]